MGSHGKEKCIEQLNYISFQHQFHIEKNDGKTNISGKKYSFVAEWGSSPSLALLKFNPDHLIFASNILLLQSVFEVHNAHRQNRDINYSDFLEEI